ncbi:MAG TPA: hypothetical protein VGF99_08200, partial [Myxococcota bacterium]
MVPPLFRDRFVDVRTPRRRARVRTQPSEARMQRTVVSMMSTLSLAAVAAVTVVAATGCGE